MNKSKVTTKSDTVLKLLHHLIDLFFYFYLHHCSVSVMYTKEFVNSFLCLPSLFNYNNITYYNLYLLVNNYDYSRIP